MTTKGQSLLAMMNIHYGTAIDRARPKIATFGDEENVKFCKIPTQSLNCPVQSVFGNLFSANYITRWQKKKSDNCNN
mgnify:CR=1 FL=1